MGYGSLGDHAPMVFDDFRNAAYARAIRSHVRSDSVVMDLGAGLGLLGLTAAASGARKVYLVEPEPVVRVALEVARVNGLANTVHVLQGRIEEVEVPEPVDLLVSVFTGNLLYSEDLLPSLFHARDRYLRTGGQMVPNRAELCVTAVEAPEVHGDRIGRWSSSRPGGFDFSLVRRFMANVPITASRDAAPLRRLSAPATVSSVDLTKAADADCRGLASVTIERDGICHGVLGWIRIQLGEAWLSTDLEAPPVHWRPVLLPVDEPFEVRSGMELEIKLDRPAGGDWTWAVRGSFGERRHSSFLSHIDLSDRLRRFSPLSRPALSREGRVALRLLESMNGQTSVEQLTSIAMAMLPLERRTEDEARRIVRDIVSRFGV